MSILMNVIEKTDFSEARAVLFNDTKPVATQMERVKSKISLCEII